MSKGTLREKSKAKTIVIEGKAAKQLATICGKLVGFSMYTGRRQGKQVVVIKVDDE